MSAVAKICVPVPEVLRAGARSRRSMRRERVLVEGATAFASSMVACVELYGVSAEPLLKPVIGWCVDDEAYIEMCDRVSYQRVLEWLDKHGVPFREEADVDPVPMEIASETYPVRSA